MEGLSFVTPITGFNRPITGKEDDDDDDCIKLWHILLVGGDMFLCSLCRTTLQSEPGKVMKL
jgi:hypothetical protein